MEKQGPQRPSNGQICARRFRYRHRYRLRACRGRHRPRIFPQLDRGTEITCRRLVSSSASRRADRLFATRNSRPTMRLARGVKRIADVRTRAGAPVFQRMPGPLAHPVRPRDLSRDQQLLPRRRSTRKEPRVVRMLKTIPRRDRLPRRAWISTSSATTVPGGHQSRISSPPSGRPRPAPTSANSGAGTVKPGTPEGSPHKGDYDARRKTYTLTLGQDDTPDTGAETSSCRCISPVRFRADRAERRRHRL